MHCFMAVYEPKRTFYSCLWHMNIYLNSQRCGVYECLAVCAAPFRHKKLPFALNPPELYAIVAYCYDLTLLRGASGRMSFALIFREARCWCAAVPAREQVLRNYYECCMSVDFNIFLCPGSDFLLRTRADARGTSCARRWRSVGCRPAASTVPRTALAQEL